MKIGTLISSAAQSGYTEKRVAYHFYQRNRKFDPGNLDDELV